MQLDDNIFTKLVDGTISQSEMRQLIDYINTSDGRQALSRHMDEEFARLESENVSMLERQRLDAIFARIEKQIKRTRRRQTILRIAAVVIPAAIVFLGLMYVHNRTNIFSPTEYTEVIARNGERTQVVFQDGTKVYLNAGSKLSYPVNFGLQERKVYLDGEAYFVVSSNKNRPFFVEIDKAEIKVTGTAFDVYAYKDDPVMTVTLDEGRIDLLALAKTYAVSPHEKLTYNRTDGNVSITKLLESDRASLWKNNIIAFDKTPLEDVIKTLRRWYDVDFKVSDIRAYQYSYTLTSDYIPLESLLEDLSVLSPVRFFYTGDYVDVTVK